MSQSINIFRGLTYKKSTHAWHLSVLECKSKIICLCAGRRTGKTFTASLVFLDRILNLLKDRENLVKQHKEKPWSGLGLSRRKARLCGQDALQALVIAPSLKHLESIQGLLENRIRQANCVSLYHSDPFLAHSERPLQNWFVYGKSALCINYCVASRDEQLRGTRASLVWIDECGEVPDRTWSTVQPLTWETNGSQILSGTPSGDESHWFTRMAISGLPIGHERRTIDIPANPNVTCFIGSACDVAYSPDVRAQAKREVISSGEDSVYTRLEIHGDWRIPSLLAFPEWNADKHICRVDRSRGIWVLRTQSETISIPRQPDRVLGGIDWYRGDSPAGHLIVAVWNLKNESDSRLLCLVLDEETVDKTSYADDYFIKLRNLQTKWVVNGWYADPSSPNLILAARKYIAMKETDNKDKLGRIALIQRQLHWNSNLSPKLLISSECKTTCDQLANYRHQRDREGNARMLYIQENDWFIDALAYVVPHCQAFFSSNIIHGPGVGV